MAEGSATRSSRGHRTICSPVSEGAYARAVSDPDRFRRLLDEQSRRTPELFPPNFAQGYQLKGDRMSVKQGLPIRRIPLKDNTAYSVRPPFLTPYMTARVADVEGPLFLRTSGAPFRAPAHVPGAGPMYRYRLGCGLGRFRAVGTAARRADVPVHLPADGRHQPLDGQKVSIATTAGEGCCLGAGPAVAAGAGEVEVAYAAFKEGARDVTPGYAPEAVSTGGGKGAQAACKALSRRVVIPRCSLHGRLKIRDRAGHLKGRFAGPSRRAWEAYHAPERGGFGQPAAPAPGVGRGAPQRNCAGGRPGPVP